MLGKAYRPSLRCAVLRNPMSSMVPESPTFSAALPAPGVQQLFERIAPAYDTLNDRLSLGLHRVWKKMAVRWCNPQSGGVYLDACCGSGDLALLLARAAGASGKVFGVDFAAAQLAIAARRSQALPPQAAPILWQEGDVLNLPFAAATFDGATLGYGLRNVADIPRCLAELQRTLKPGAIAAILDFHRPTNLAIARVQQWYLARVVVPAACERGLEAEYAYIADSLARFPAGKTQERLAQAAGFARARHYPLVGGMMGVLVAQR